jgi:SAM-dependent methyltransferase
MPTHDPFAEVAEVYDIMIDWPARLARERPFFVRVVGEAPVRRALDVGCGSGHHARMLAELGVETLGIDPSGPMLARARALTEGDNPRFAQAGFAEIGTLGGGFGLIAIVGNTLGHVRSDAELRAMLGDCRAALVPGGRLVLQVVNYDAVMRLGDRRLPLIARERDGHEHLFLREYRRHDRMAEFTITTLRQEGADWCMHVERTIHLPLTAARLRRALRAAGFTRIALSGDYAGAPYAPASSGALVVEAT